MEYRSQTFFLAFCLAALGTAQSQSGLLDIPLDPLRTDCDGAREIIYQLPVGIDEENNAIFDEMREVKEPSMCHNDHTCCSKSAEQNLTAMSVTAVRDSVLELWNDVISPCNVSLFKEALKTYIQESKASLVELLMRAFLGFFTRHNLFDEFYEYLEQAIDTGNTCRISYQFNKLFFELFLAVLEADPTVDTSVYPNNDTFNLCLYNYYKELNSEEVHKKFLALTRSFNRTLYYIRALNTAEEFLNEVLKLDYSPQCRQALMKSTYCAQCSGYPTSVATCTGLCLNALRGCLIDYTDLYEPFRSFTTAAIRMKEYLDSNVNPFNHIGQLTTAVFDMIADINSISSTISEQILLRCLASNRRRRDTDSNPQESTFRINRSIFPRSTVAPPSNVFNNSAYCMLKVAPLFKSVPDKVCGVDTEIPTQQACWNGNAIGSYDRETLPFNRTAQEDNPEMIVCHRLPRALRVQLAHLERVTQEMNIISRSRTCPEDDEDCSVNAQRCDYNSRRPVNIPVDSPMFDMEREEDGGTEYDSGYGSGYSGYSGVSSGSGSGFGSGEEEVEADACLIDPLESVSLPTPTQSVFVTSVFVTTTTTHTHTDTDTVSTPTPSVFVTPTTTTTTTPTTTEEPMATPTIEPTATPTQEPSIEPPSKDSGGLISVSVPSISSLLAALLASSVVAQTVL